MVWPRLPAMPAIDETSTTCPPSRRPSWPRNASFIRRIESRLTSRTERHRSASVFASSLSRVMPALWTTTSSPPWRVRAWSRMRRAGVGCRDVGLQRGAAHLVRHRGERRAGGGHVDADDGRTVARQDPGDVGADAAGRPGDDGHLAGERPRGVGRRGGRLAPHPEHLGVDVGRSRGEQELDGAQTSRLGAGGEEDEVRGGPGPELLGDRARDALEGPRAARAAASVAPAGSSPTTTTRAQRPSRVSAGPSVARSDSRSAGVVAAVMSTTTPPSRSSRGPRRRGVAPASSSPARRAAGRGVSPWPPTSTGPSTSGRPGS